MDHVVEQATGQATDSSKGPIFIQLVPDFEPANSAIVANDVITALSMAELAMLGVPPSFPLH